MIKLPKTGQTISYAPGDDGDLQKGLAWPDPRFTDNDDGTMTDNLTGLMWAKDGSTPEVGSCGGGTKSWQDALNYVVCLNSATYLGYNDWRLPNVNELTSLVNVGEANSAEWLNRQGVMNVQSSHYWSSSTDAHNASNAWLVGIDGCSVASYGKAYGYLYVWPVRAGLFGSYGNSVIWPTGQTKSDDANTPQRDDGALKTGTAWLEPRFTDNGDGTVKDSLTGLIWLKDSGCLGKATWNDAILAANSLTSGKYGLSDNSRTGDWRLPNRNELRSLIDYGKYGPALPFGNPFTNEHPFSYWSSSTPAYSSSLAWVVNMYYGYVDVNVKVDDYPSYVWPVRAGQ